MTPMPEQAVIRGMRFFYAHTGAGALWLEAEPRYGPRCLGRYGYGYPSAQR